MGDYSFVGITFYDVPEEDVPGVVRFLIDQGMVDYKERELILGEQYTLDEAGIGWIDEQVTPLVERRPGLTVEAVQADRYEYNGEQLYHRPDLDTFVGEGDEEVILNQAAIDQAYAELGEDATAGDLHAAILRLMGQPWVSEFAALRNGRFDFKNRKNWPVLTAPEDLAQALEDEEEN